MQSTPVSLLERLRQPSEQAAWERERADEAVRRHGEEEAAREKRQRRAEEVRALEIRARELVRQAEREWRKAREERAEPDTRGLRAEVRRVQGAFDQLQAESGPGESPSRPVGSLAVGQRVRHRKFGEGIILNTEGSGAHARVQVNFESAGTKWLVMAYANLELM